MEELIESIFMQGYAYGHQAGRLRERNDAEGMREHVKLKDVYMSVDEFKKEMEELCRQKDIS
jgi:hypothetical protein